MVEDRGGEQLDAGLSGSPAKPRNRRTTPDESLSDKTIIAITAAVIAIGFGFTALLPSILTRPGVQSTAAVMTSTARSQPRQIEQVGAVQPVIAPTPAQPPAPAPPQIEQVGAVQPVIAPTPAQPPAPAPPASAKQADGRVAGADVRVPNAGKGAAASRTALTAEEKAAVDRGLQELERTAAISAPPRPAPTRPAPTRPALTEEEKAAVERGLRELEKEAAQAKQ